MPNSTEIAALETAQLETKTLEITAPQIIQRPRRLRGSAALRDAVAETWLRPTDLIAPFFIVNGKAQTQPVAALPGISRLSVDVWLRELETALELGIKTALLFGVLGGERKDETASSASDPDGPVPSALRAARLEFGHDLTLVTDVCLCAHTSHGHCGVLRETARGVIVDNDASLIGLSRMALTHAEAGADFVAPSDMMDGRVAHIRRTLDAHGHTDVGIISYAVKFASAFYGPFREAAGSAPAFGDRSSYQMDHRNLREGLREAALDEAEGADMLMVKPALAYLDVIARVRAQTALSVVAYNVSGEYAMLKAAAQIGALDEPRAVRETLTGIKRAGADLIVSYHALEAVQKGWLT